MNEGKSCERRQRFHRNMTGSAVIGSCSKCVFTSTQCTQYTMLSKLSPFTHIRENV